MQCTHCKGTGELIEEVETEDKDIMIYLDGSNQSYHCECGCNVFRNVKSRIDKFVCNSCKAVYTGAE